MSERPTPETDAFITLQDYSPTGHQWRNFTRKLERERDEVNEELHKQMVRYDQLFDEAAKIWIERDRAREKAERYRLEANAMMLQRDEARELVYAWESRWKAEVEFAAKVSVKRDELQDILRKLLGIIPEPECHDFGHTKEERHTFFEKCPVMERYDALIAQAKEAAK